MREKKQKIICPRVINVQLTSTSVYVPSPPLLCKQGRYMYRCACQPGTGIKIKHSFLKKKKAHLQLNYLQWQMASYYQLSIITALSGCSLEMLVFRLEIFLLAITLAAVMGFDLCLLSIIRAYKVCKQESNFRQVKESKNMARRTRTAFCGTLQLNESHSTRFNCCLLLQYTADLDFRRFLTENKMLLKSPCHSFCPT